MLPAYFVNMVGFMVVVSAGMLQTFKADENVGIETIYDLTASNRVETVPMPPHPTTDLIAYCPGDAASFRPRVRVEGYPYLVPGPVVILALEGDRHRPLTAEEAAAFMLGPEGPDGLPVLHIRSE